MTFQFTETLKDLTGVPDQFKAMYVAQEDGSYRLDAADPKVKGAVEAIVGLNKALAAERRTKTPAVDLTPLKDFGDTPEAIAETIAARIAEAQAGASGTLKTQVEKIKADLAVGHRGEIDKVTARSTALQNQLYKLLVENRAREATAAAKGETDLLMPFIKERVEVREENGEYQVFVVDADRSIRYNGVTGGPMTIPDLVAEMKGNERYGRLFASEAPTGGGTPPAGPAGRPAQGPTGTPEMSATDKIRSGLKKGQFQRGGIAR